MKKVAKFELVYSMNSNQVVYIQNFFDNETRFIWEILFVQLITTYNKPDLKLEKNKFDNVII